MHCRWQEGAAGASSTSGQQPPAAPTKTNKKQGGPRGLPPLPPRSTLRTLLPSPDHSTQPLGLPLKLLGQAAARGPMYRYQGNRLLRGVLGLAATLLLCRWVASSCRQLGFRGGWEGAPAARGYR